MIIRAKHTCESDLRAFCTKMHLKHLLHKQPTPKSFSYIILNFPPISTLYIVLVWKRFSGCFEEICFASSPQVGRLVHTQAGLGHPLTISHVCGPQKISQVCMCVKRLIHHKSINPDCSAIAKEWPNLLTICEKWVDSTAILNQPLHSGWWSCLSPEWWRGQHKCMGISDRPTMAHNRQNLHFYFFAIEDLVFHNPRDCGSIVDNLQYKYN